MYEQLHKLNCSVNFKQMTILFQTSILLSFIIFFVPKHWKYSVGLISHALLIISSAFWALTAFSQMQQLQVPMGVSTWSGEIVLVVDKLSAYFILIVDLIYFAGIIYGGGYLKPYITKKRGATLSIHLFSFFWLHAAMILVTSLHDGLAFLLGWELMSLFSFILVIFEGEKESTLKTGINYLLQMHLGFALIMFGFLVVSNATGEMSFEALGQYFGSNPNFGLFIIFFIGFGIKAGFMPMHTWLPLAHPAAPAHVSGIMSGVMIKMGIYGILRVVSVLHNDFAQIGSTVLLISMVSGVMGVVLAIMQHDLKKLLAYHSIENIGIIGIGIGLSILGQATNNSYLVVLGMAGALLHNLNHALFKSLLFFSAGNVYHATHTVNMEELGGIVKPMRTTSILFLIGALAISGIPPFNGFVSEFLIYNGIVNTLTQAHFTMSLASVTAMVSLVLIGGLCLYCFTKAFGITFLGSRRGHHHNHPVTEVPIVMIAPLLVLVSAIIFIGIFPVPVISVLSSVLQTFGNLKMDVTELQNSVSSLQQVSIANGVLVAVVGGIWAIRYWQQKQVKISEGPTWGCGYSAGDSKHQYTPTSYADSVRQLADPFISFHRKYKPIGETEIFPEHRSFHTESNDKIEQSGIKKVIQGLVQYLPYIGFAQTGQVRHYLIYPLAFILIMALLTFLNYL